MDETVWWIELVCDADREKDLRAVKTIEDMELTYTSYMFLQQEKTTA